MTSKVANVSRKRHLNEPLRAANKSYPSQPIKPCEEKFDAEQVDFRALIEIAPEAWSFFRLLARDVIAAHEAVLSEASEMAEANKGYPTFDDIERKARRMCRENGGGPDEMIPDGDGDFPRWHGWILRAHRALESET